MPDPAPRPGFETARRRLEEALARLEVRVGSLQASRGASGGLDAARLRAELDDAYGRERRLEQVAAEASAALGRAAAEVRAALAAQA